MASAAPQGAKPTPSGTASSKALSAGKSVFGRTSRDNAGAALGAVTTSKGSVQHEAAGFVLGAFFWCWVVLPFLSGGPTAVKNTLRAKFVNEGADGKQL